MPIGIIYSKAQQIIRARIDTRIDVEPTGEFTAEGQPMYRHVPAQNPGDHHLKAHKDNLLPGEEWALVPAHIHDSFPHHTRHQDLHDYLGLKGRPNIDDHYHVIDLIAVPQEGDHVFNGAKIIGNHTMDPEIDMPAGKWRNSALAAHYKDHHVVKAKT